MQAIIFLIFAFLNITSGVEFESTAGTKVLSEKLLQFYRNKRNTYKNLHDLKNELNKGVNIISQLIQTDHSEKNKYVQKVIDACSVINMTLGVTLNVQKIRVVSILSNGMDGLKEWNEPLTEVVRYIKETTKWISFAQNVTRRYFELSANKTVGISLMKNMESYLSKYDTLKKETIDDAQVRMLKDVLQSEPTYISHDEETLIVHGNSIRMSEVEKKLERKYPRARVIEIAALQSVVFDGAFVKTGKNLRISVIAPKVTFGDPVEMFHYVMLGGEAGKIHPKNKALNGILAGHSGKDGLPGTAGYAGGHFLLVAQEIETSTPILFRSKGGLGGDGQDGGDGIALRDQIFENPIRFSLPCGHFFNLALSSPNITYRQLADNIYVFFPAGGKGGRPGIAGKGGKKGKITIVTSRNEKFKIIDISEDGNDGFNGKGGLTGDQKPIKTRLDRNPDGFCSFKTMGRSNDTMAGNNYVQKFQRPLIEEIFKPNFAIINSYKYYAAGKSASKSFLKWLNSNLEVTSLYTISAFVDELLRLERRYFSTKDKSKLYPEYRSLLVSLGEFAKRNVTGNEDLDLQNKKILTYLYTAVLGKMLVQLPKTNNVIINIRDYLEMTLRNIKTFESTQSEVEREESDHFITQEQEKFISIERNDYVADLKPLLEQSYSVVDDIVYMRNATVDSNFSAEVTNWLRVFAGYFSSIPPAGGRIFGRILATIRSHDEMRILISLKTMFFDWLPPLMMEQFNKLKLENLYGRIPEKSLRGVIDRPKTRLKFFDDGKFGETYPYFASASHKLILNKAKVDLYISRLNIVDSWISFLNIIPLLSAKSNMSKLRMLDDSQSKQESLAESQSAAIDDYFRNLDYYKPIVGLNLHILMRLIKLTYKVFEQVRLKQTEMSLTDFMAAISSVSIRKVQVADGPFRDALKRLKLMIASNTVLHLYQKAVQALKNFIFPFVHDYIDDFLLPTHLKLDQSLDLLVAIAAKNIRTLRKKLRKSSSSLTPNHEIYLHREDFTSKHVITKPFYKWSSSKVHSLIKKLFAGETIIFDAPVEHTVQGNAVKFTEIGLYFKVTGVGKYDLQEKVDAAFGNFDVEMIHSGLNYYKCDDYIYVMTTLSQTISFSYLKQLNGDPVTANFVYEKLKNGDPILSPYTSWKIRLIQKGNLTLSELHKYYDKVDVELEGRGQYVSAQYVCNNKLKYMYELKEDKPISKQRYAATRNIGGTNLKPGFYMLYSAVVSLFYLF